jgi:hypothetical protein
MLLSRELAFSLLQSLPPELRMIIFEYFTMEDCPVAPGFRDHSLALDPRGYEGDVEELVEDRIKSNHWLQTKFMGPLTSEIVDIRNRGRLVQEDHFPCVRLNDIGRLLHPFAHLEKDACHSRTLAATYGRGIAR